jgi:hypothetical protein
MPQILRGGVSGSLFWYKLYYLGGLHRISFLSVFLFLCWQYKNVVIIYVFLFIPGGVMLCGMKVQFVISFSRLQSI